MSDTAERISPLLHLVEPGIFGANPDAPAVEISERLPIALVQLQAWPDMVEKLSKAAKPKLGVSLPESGAASIGDEIVMASGPGRWLVESDNPLLETELRDKINSDVGVVTGLTHARVVVTISGEKADWILATGVPLDFHENAFPVGDVQLSHHHEIGMTIHRVSEQSFDLYVFTSYARSFWQWITKASAEVGYRVS